MPTRNSLCNVWSTATVFLVLAASCLMPGTIHGFSLDKALKTADQALGNTASPQTSASGLSNSDIIAGLKEALNVAVDKSVDFLGKPGGYLDNAEVRIPMPSHLSTTEKLARAMGQENLADEFISSMNHAAEKAVPETVSILGNAIKTMSVEDAQGILNGPDDAATRFFERTSSAELAERIRPIVSKTMESVGVTQDYKAFTQGAASLGALLNQNWFDLDGYVTDKAVKGLFTIMAAEEKRIRENPLARTSDLLQKVFGSVN